MSGVMLTLILRNLRVVLVLVLEERRAGPVALMIQRRKRREVLVSILI